jgi:hypothetical protein
MNLNADFTKRAVVHAATLAWKPSPMPGVERERLRASESPYRVTTSAWHLRLTWKAIADASGRRSAIPCRMSLSM